jgi:hypothetical protein
MLPAEILRYDDDGSRLDARCAGHHAVGRRLFPRMRFAGFRLFGSECADLVERAGLDETFDSCPCREPAALGQPFHGLWTSRVQQRRALGFDRGEDFPLPGIGMMFHGPLRPGLEWSGAPCSPIKAVRSASPVAISRAGPLAITRPFCIT